MFVDGSRPIQMGENEYINKGDNRNKKEKIQRSRKKRKRTIVNLYKSKKYGRKYFEIKTHTNPPRNYFSDFLMIVKSIL